MTSTKKQYDIVHKYNDRYNYGQVFDTLAKAQHASPWLDDSKHEESDFEIHEYDVAVDDDGDELEAIYVATHQF